MCFWWRAADSGGFCSVAEISWCCHRCCRLLLLSGKARELQHNTVVLALLVPPWQYRDLKVLDRSRPDPVATTRNVWHRIRFLRSPSSGNRNFESMYCTLANLFLFFVLLLQHCIYIASDELLSQRNVRHANKSLLCLKRTCDNINNIKIYAKRF